jgi:dTDP-4-amino-4,6-dideoxygalactose transaminase
LFIENKSKYLEILDEVGSKGAFILQKDLVDFERNLANFTKSEFALGVANATDGLEMAWKSLNLKRGDEVIISSHTMIATASAIISVGAKPIPVEICDDGLMDPEAVSAAINSRTVGISPTHLNGRTCKMDQLLHLSAKHALFIVEDAAQGLGSKYRDKFAGTFGNFSSISFFPAKILGSFGDGGAVLTQNKSHFESIYQMRDHGRDINGVTKSWGRNSRLDNMQAAILNLKLRDLPQVIDKRRMLANLYHSLLSQVEQVILPPKPEQSTDHFDTYQNYEIQVDDRNALRSFLASKGVGTIIQWGGQAIHEFKNLGFDYKLPRVEKYFTKCLLLPMNVFLTESDVHYIVEQIKDFYSK